MKQQVEINQVDTIQEARMLLPVKIGMELKYLEIERVETDEDVRNRTNDIETRDKETKICIPMYQAG